MTLFCLFSLSIVKIAGLRSLWCPLSGLLEVCGSHSTAMCQVILHWVWTGFRVLRLETLDCFLFHILQKSIFVCLFIEQVMWLGSKCKFHVLGGSPNSISIRLPLIQKPAPGVWGERDLGRATYRALAWAPFQDRLTFAFLVSFFFFFFWAERIWHLAQAGFSCLIWHRLVTAFRLEAVTPKQFTETGAAKTWARTILLPPAGSTPDPVDWPDSRLSRHLHTVSSRLCKVGTDANFCLSGSEELTAEEEAVPCNLGPGGLH